MQDKKALEYFHGKEKYNCAQAIIKAFESDSESLNLQVDDFKKDGGGRAEEGMCGALYAAAQLISECEVESLKINFSTQTGSEKCKDIKNMKKASCKDCVRIAAEILLKIKEKN
ncbi:MAG: C-GCAxxG-C-C family (seleno)protein [Planctomycetota bacterium]